MRVTQREQVFYDMRESGRTFTSIATDFNLSPTRIRQIYVEYLCKMGWWGRKHAERRRSEIVIAR